MSASDAFLAIRIAILSPVGLVLLMLGHGEVAATDPEQPPIVMQSYTEPVAVVGFEHQVGALFFRQLPNKVEFIAGITVHVEVTGANHASGSCVTGQTGCSVRWVGTNVGLDEVKLTSDATDEVGAATVEWKPAPPNDDFSGRIAIPALPYHYENHFTRASLEDGEERPCGLIQETVWFSYTPKDREFVSVVADNEPGATAVFAADGLPRDFLECKVGLDRYMWLEPHNTYYFQLGTRSQNLYDLFFDLAVAPLGDGDCDLDVDSSDAWRILWHIAYFGKPKCDTAADVNCDGLLTATDALVILKRLQGLSDEIGCA